VYHDLEDVVNVGEDVTIRGDFNGWGAVPIIMTPNAEYSVFTAVVPIIPGSYGYKYFMPDLPVNSDYDMLNTNNRTLVVSTAATVDDYRNVVVGWAHLGDPIAVTIFLGEDSGDLVGEDFIANVTNPAGEGRGVAAQLGYGTLSDPLTWAWADMTYTGDVGNNDLYAATITPAATGVYTYGVRFDGNWATGNPNIGWTYGDRTGLLTVLEPPSADLAVTKVAPATVLTGETFTYTIEVVNNGPDDATGVEVEDTLPAGVTFVSASAGCVEAAGVVTCDVGDLAALETAMIDIVVTSPAAGNLVNNVTVAGNEADPDLANNAAFAGTTVNLATRYVYLPLMYRAP
jgi:uncharacterized repeat protein (TIGR01451 family)